MYQSKLTDVFDIGSLQGQEIPEIGHYSQDIFLILFHLLEKLILGREPSAGSFESDFYQLFLFSRLSTI